MKFSFLLPSKNRLELLKFAVDSILRQNYRDVEIVISDNASEQDYAGFVSGLRDDRVVYRRMAEPVSVTENWNNALSIATGDYVLMLGDDDALAPWFIEKVSRQIGGGGQQPDIIYFSAYHYCYPNVMPSSTEGYLADVRNSAFFRNRSGPFLLPTDRARSVARAACDFRYQFGFNSQHFLFRAGFLNEISAIGSIFQSPYPDTFAAVVSFLKARSVRVVPEPMVIIGISPKSFGYYYFNDQQTEGYEFLNNAKVSADVRDSLRNVLLPGDRNNTNWLIAVEVARRVLAIDTTLTVNVRRYRMLQIVAFLRSVYLQSVRQRSEVGEFLKLLAPLERLMCRALWALVAVAKVCGRIFVSGIFKVVDRLLGQFWPAKVTMIDIGRHSNIGDAFNWLAACETSNLGGK